MIQHLPLNVLEFTLREDGMSLGEQRKQNTSLIKYQSIEKEIFFNHTANRCATAQDRFMQ